MNLLVRTLPFIIGERFRHNIYFKNFLLLLNIFFQLNADQFDEQKAYAKASIFNSLSVGYKQFWATIKILYFAIRIEA
jgi:hypothetical protein